MCRTECKGSFTADKTAMIPSPLPVLRRYHFALVTNEETAVLTAVLAHRDPISCLRPNGVWVDMGDECFQNTCQGLVLCIQTVLTGSHQQVFTS